MIYETIGKTPKVSTESRSSSNPRRARTIGRRELLKALAMGSSTVAVSPLVPHRWARPVIEAGLLPFHAQISALTIGNLQVKGPILTNQSVDVADVFGRSAANISGGNNIISYVYQASFSYNDPLGQVNENSSLAVTERYQPSNSLIFDTTSLVAIGAKISGDGFSGMIEEIIFSVFYGDFQPNCGIICQGDSTLDTAVNISFYLDTGDGRQSNTLEDTRPRPVN